MSYCRLGPQHLPLYVEYTKLGSLVGLVTRPDRLSAGDGFSGGTGFRGPSGTEMLTGRFSGVAACGVDSVATGLVGSPSVASPPSGKLSSV